MSRKSAYLRLALPSVAGLTLASLAAISPAQAGAHPTVQSQIQHYIECAHWMATDPAKHEQFCGPGFEYFLKSTGSGGSSSIGIGAIPNNDKPVPPPVVVPPVVVPPVVVPPVVVPPVVVPPEEKGPPPPPPPPSQGCEVHEYAAPAAYILTGGKNDPCDNNDCHVNYTSYSGEAQLLLTTGRGKDCDDSDCRKTMAYSGGGELLLTGGKSDCDPGCYGKMSGPVTTMTDGGMLLVTEKNRCDPKPEPQPCGGGLKLGSYSLDGINGADLLMVGQMGGKCPEPSCTTSSYSLGAADAMLLQVGLSGCDSECPSGKPASYASDYGDGRFLDVVVQNKKPKYDNGSWNNGECGGGTYRNSAPLTMPLQLPQFLI